MTKPKSENQKKTEKVIKEHGGKKVVGRNATYDMTNEVKKEGDKGKDKSK